MRLLLLDQRYLPEKEDFFVCDSVENVIEALKTMVVRGAPAIGVTAGFACVLAVKELLSLPSTSWEKHLREQFSRIAHARPTAVNLQWAVSRMEQCLSKQTLLDPKELLQICLAEAKRMQEEDCQICRQIGRNGAALIHDHDTVLTHCNAGALATAGYGTALGVIRAAFEEGKRIHVIADETRPFLQGARLTAWELQRDGIPVTVACDNACALLMQQGRIQCVVVGADRIAANGDTANKIGTFGVALLAKHFQIPFFIAAPLSTIDRSLSSGSLIPIEERPSSEVISFGSRPVVPSGVPVFNFAFDVTPNALISGIITEKGVLRSPYTKTIQDAVTS